MEADAQDAAKTIAKYAADRAAARATGLARIGIELAMKKSQNRAGGTSGGGAPQIPGFNIEAQFRPFHELVKGDPGKRPIDILIANFYEIYQSLVLQRRIRRRRPARQPTCNAARQACAPTPRACLDRLPAWSIRLSTTSRALPTATRGRSSTRC